MTRPLRAAGLLLAVLLAACGLYALWWDEEPEGAGLPWVDEEDVGERVRGPGLRAHGRSAAVMAGPSQGGIDGSVTFNGLPVAAKVLVYRLASVPWGGARWSTDPASWGNSARPYPVALHVAETMSDAQGRYAVDGLPGGHYRLVAVRDKQRGSSRHGFLVGDGRRLTMQLQLDVGSATVRGRVHYASGAPWKGRVYATPTWDRRWFAGLLPGDAPGVGTDAEGRFEIRGAPFGPLRLQAIGEDDTRALSRRFWTPHEGEVDIVIPDPEDWVSIRVTGARDGKPIPQAVVLGSGYSPHQGVCMFRSVLTDPQGIARVPPGEGDLWVRVEAHGWARADIVVEHGQTSAHVSLSRTARVLGRVVAYGTGEPIAGVSVHLSEGCFAVTGADGRFELIGAPPGDHWLQIEGEGWRPRALAGFEQGGWPVTLLPSSTSTVELVAWKGLRVKGRVVDASGEAIAGASIHAHDKGSNGLRGSPLAAARSLPDGSFELTGLQRHTKYGIHCTAPGHGSHVIMTWEHKAEEAPEPLELTLLPPRRIDIHVLDEAGAPIPGVRVALGGHGPLWTYAVTDEAGWARVGNLTRGSLELWARCEGFVVHNETIAARGPEDAAVEELELSLGAGGTVVGKVVWNDGSPAANVKVHLPEIDESDTTEDDGTFRIYWVPQGTHLLEARDKRVKPPRVAIEHVTTGGGAVTVRIEADPPEPDAPPVEIRILDPHGQLVGAAKVAATIQGKVRSFDADNGVAEVPAGWSELTIQQAASSTGAPLPAGPLSLPAHDGSTMAMTVMLPAERAIEGWITTPDGQPVGGALVEAEGAGAGHSVRSDATGAFRLGRLAEERYTLTVRPPQGHLARQVEAVAGEERVTLVLTPAARARLTVIDADGEAVSGAKVKIKRNGPYRFDPDPTFEGRTNAEGGIQPLQLDPAGRYQVQVWAPQGRKDLRYALVEAWEPADTQIRLERAYAIEGVVMSSDGHPIADADVRGVSQGADADVRTDRTDEQGRFRIEGFRQGRVALTAGVENRTYGRWSIVKQNVLREVHSERKIVMAGASGVRLEIESGAPLEIQVRGWAGLRSRGINIVLRLDEDEGYRFRNDAASEVETFTVSATAEGWIRFKQAPKGAKYTLFIGGLRGGHYVLQRGLVGRRQPYHLEARKGGTLSGVLHAPHGVQADEVSLEFERGLTYETPTDEHGGFEVHGVPPGTVRVYAYGRRRPGAWNFFGEAHAQAGATVAIHLREDED